MCEDKCKCSQNLNIIHLADEIGTLFAFSRQLNDKLYEFGAKSIPALVDAYETSFKLRARLSLLYTALDKQRVEGGKKDA